MSLLLAAKKTKNRVNFEEISNEIILTDLDDYYDIKLQPTIITTNTVQKEKTPNQIILNHLESYFNKTLLSNDKDKFKLKNDMSSSNQSTPTNTLNYKQGLLTYASNQQQQNQLTEIVDDIIDNPIVQFQSLNSKQNNTKSHVTRKTKSKTSSASSSSQTPSSSDDDNENYHNTDEKKTRAKNRKRIKKDKNDNSNDTLDFINENSLRLKILTKQLSSPSGSKENSHSPKDILKDLDDNVPKLNVGCYFKLLSIY